MDLQPNFKGTGIGLDNFYKLAEPKEGEVTYGLSVKSKTQTMVFQCDSAKGLLKNLIDAVGKIHFETLKEY